MELLNDDRAGTCQISATSGVTCSFKHCKPIQGQGPLSLPITTKQFDKEQLASSSYS